jgi:pimeloyl-ACP methyl ester carboxylesterase
MGLDWYGKWMTRWETDLTTRDTNRIVRPLEWGFDWLAGFSDAHVPGAKAQVESGALLPGRPTAEALGYQSRPISETRPSAASGVSTLAEVGEESAGSEDLDCMIALSEEIVRRSDDFFGYTIPTDFRLEQRHPELFPTNVRPETLAQDAEMKRLAAEGELEQAEFLRFTSAVRTPYPENDQVNARWYPAPAEREGSKQKQQGRPKQAIIVMPQWNADALSHNALCSMANWFGVSALRLSKPYHDIRRPAELERSDYAMSANIGRTISSCRQAVVDIRSCMDWLETQGYTQFGVLGTSLGSCYAFIAAAHDPRLRVCAFNHASTWFGDVVWEGQSTRHVRAGFEQAGLTQDQVRRLFLSISPMAYMERFAVTPKRALVVHATYDLTFPLHLSLDVLENFERCGIDYVSRVLPCGHYTTGETPFKYLDGWYLGSFMHSAFRDLAERG